MFGYFLLFKDVICFVYFRSNKILEKLYDSWVFRVTVLICILAVFVQRNMESFPFLQLCASLQGEIFLLKAFLQDILIL